MSPTPRSRPDISPELALVDPELRRVALLLLPDPGAFAAVARAEPAAITERPPSPRVVFVNRSRRRVWSRRAVLGSMAAAVVVLTWASAVTPANQRPTLVSVDPPFFGSPQPSTGRVENELTRARRALPQRQAAPEAKPATRHRLHSQGRRRPSQSARKHAETRRTSPRRSREVARASTAAPVTRVRAERARLSWDAVPGASYYNVIIWRKGHRVLDLWPSVNKAILPRSWSLEGKRKSLSPGRYFWFVYPGFGAKADAAYGDTVQTGVLVIDRK